MVLYGRAGCHLCDEARVVVAEVCEDAGVPWAEVDVDDPAPPGGGPDPFEAYGDRVPVVAVDGVEVGQWRISGRTLRAALAPGAVGPVA